MQRPSRTVRTAGGALCPDLATLTKKMFDAGIPLLGVSLTPSFRTLPRAGSVNKPTIGLVKRDEVKAALLAVGLPLDGYLTKVRTEPDAFRLAISAIQEDRDFKRSGYFLREVKDSPSNELHWVVVEERHRDENLKSIDYGTAQYVIFDRDTGHVHFDKRPGHRIITPGGLIQPDLIYWWNRFLECLTTEDVSHMVANYLRYYCGGVPMRKGGGQYFVPKTQDAWPMNGELAVVQAFCDKIKGLGDIGVVWSDLPIPDADSVRANMTHHVNQEIGGVAKRVGNGWKKLKEEVETKGKTLRTATGDGKIAELAALERRCELYINLGLVEIEQQRDAVKNLRLEIKRELTSAVKGEKGDLLADLLAGGSSDIYGEGMPGRVVSITASDFSQTKAASNGHGSVASPSLDELLEQFSEAEAA